MSKPKKQRPIFQLYPDLDPATESALRASIALYGVLVPIAEDQRGRTLDGHHRRRIADELGVRYAVKVIDVGDDDEAREIARTLNEDRRHLTRELRQEVVAALSEQGHSTRAIAGTVKAAHSTVVRDLAKSGGAIGTPDGKVTGRDGKRYPAKATEPVDVAWLEQRADDRALAAVRAVVKAIDRVRGDEVAVAFDRAELATLQRLAGELGLAVAVLSRLRGRVEGRLAEGGSVI